MTATPTPSADLSGARAAFDERRWADAREGLAAVEATTELDVYDLERLADATWWLGRLPQAIEIRQRIFKSFKGAGNRVGAARTALHLVSDHSQRLEPSIAAG
jgi:hypothetical protein